MIYSTVSRNTIVRWKTQQLSGKTLCSSSTRSKQEAIGHTAVGSITDSRGAGPLYDPLRLHHVLLVIVVFKLELVHRRLLDGLAALQTLVQYYKKRATRNWEG